MDIDTLIDTLATDDSYSDLDKLKQWRSSQLFSNYRHYFSGFSTKAISSIGDLPFVEVTESGIDRDYGFELSIFGGMAYIQVELNFERVKGFNLLGHISISTVSDHEQVKLERIYFNKNGEILNPESGRLLAAKKIDEAADLIIGSVIHNAVPAAEFPDK